MTRKWRPPLWFVLGGALAWTLVLSLLGIVILRYLGPEIGFKNAAIILALGIGILTAILWLLLVRLLLRPVTALAIYAADVRSGSTGNATEPKRFGTQELHTMGQSVLEMARTLSSREQTVRNFTDHVIHEVKTPVSTVQAATELLQDSADLAPADRVLVGQIRAAGKQMQAQLAALRETVMARESDYHGQTMLAPLYEKLTADCQTLEIKIEGGAVSIPLSRDGLLIVLGHLTRNAVAHGATSLTLSAVSGQNVSLRIADNGTGVSAGNQSRMFDPFFTSRRNSGGTGMGLYIVKTLLQGCNADITLTPTTAGATFLINFASE